MDKKDRIAQAMDEFLEPAEYDAASDAFYQAMYRSFQAGWEAAMTYMGKKEGPSQP